MTTAARARDTPGRAPIPQPFEGGLFVDLDGQRAKYECLRPGCPHPLEGPVCATDRVRGEDGALAPRGPGGVAAFVAGIKAFHLTKHHGSTR
ncbi:hypothetical protein [Streptomyces sp. E5N91]|uniref:hypothetical protein n=1 Tax=Streptomyces sp. E5N91 TaxID=1851996 RepID=UPI000EF591B6|nr:hypothetical protein [Streptomyces sp. E5N91]